MQENATLESWRRSEPDGHSGSGGLALQRKRETNEVSNLITGQQITQLATNGRNVVSLTMLGTGVSSMLPSFNGVTAQGSNFGTAQRYAAGS